MFIHLCIIYGCFCATTAELNSYNKGQIALFKAKNIWLFTEKLCMEGYWVFRVIGNSSIDSLNPLENHILQPTPSLLVDKIVSETNFKNFSLWNTCCILGCSVLVALSTLIIEWLIITVGPRPTFYDPKLKTLHYNTEA